MNRRKSLHAATRLLFSTCLVLIASGCSSCKDPEPGAGDGSVDAMVPPLGCGDGALDPSEVCDDHNNADGDGCAWNCAAIDPHFLCPTPGAACIRVVTCGNGRIEGDETCDDRNTVATDGCDSDCHKQPGWTCAPVGVACVATQCGDGIVAGFEACDDAGNAAPGCSATCQLQPGYQCPTPGAACTTTTCGDGIPQGTEHCDDGNAEVGDGCDPLCHREPNCSGGTCVAECGDSVKWAPEACDDGNTVGGDGCSADCSTIEPGFECVEMELPLPGSIDLPVTYRDFMANCNDTDADIMSNSGIARFAMGQAGAVAPYGHPDFDCFDGADGAQTNGGLPDYDMVQNTLDADGKPVRGTETGLTQSAASFAQWYRTTPQVNIAIAQTLPLGAIGGGAYQFSDTTFFPITNAGWALVDCDSGTPGVQPCEDTRPYAGNQRFFFTSEAHFWFRYQGDGNEVLTFLGDDDVWVFIDGKLVVDLGGVHGPVTNTLDLDDYVNNCDGTGDPSYCEAPLPLVVGNIYEGIVFQAERHVSGSNYTLTLTGFSQAPSICTDDCGDGDVSSREACDLGDAMNGNGDGSLYGGCTTSCTFEPFCGDGVTDTAFGETCDDGINLGGTASACSPGCGGTGAECGDGVLQLSAGEQCDDANTVSGDGCSFECILELE